MSVHAMFNLDRAQTERRLALLPRPKGRVIQTGHLTFVRSRLGLVVSYPWGGGAYRNTVELIPVGDRIAILRCGKFDRIVDARELLAGLRGYRKDAATALQDRHEAEARFE